MGLGAKMTSLPVLASPGVSSDFRAETGWFAVLPSRALKRAPVGIRRLGRDLVFFRDRAGVAHAFEDLCPHRQTRLSLGRVVEGTLECPFHGFRFAPEGHCVAIPAHPPSEPLPKAMRACTLPVREAWGFLYVWGHKDVPPTGEPPVFAHLADIPSYASFSAIWHTHYSRAIENQLDFAHLPFVHATTIGRGMSPRLDVRLEDEPGRIRYRALREGNEPREDQYIEWRAPNVWVNQITKDFAITVAFAPIDGQRTEMYLRTYQRFVQVPLLRGLVHGLMNVANRRVLRQDQRVVEAQRPHETALQMGERLVPFDRPVIAFRRQRETWRTAVPDDTGDR